MNRILSFLLGACEVELSGAAPERCINALPAAKIAVWDIRYIDEMHDRFSVLRKDRKLLSKVALQNYCTVERCRETGLPVLIGKLISRPVLLICMLISLFLTFFLQSFVWVIEVQGNETIPTEQIVRALEEQGLRFGAWASSINSQDTKNRMLNEISELSWLAVNRTGGKLAVLVTEREKELPEIPEYETVNIVAAKDGVITDFSISEGMKLCARGDTVKKGQILVSGYEDYGLFVRNVCAEAEIYATTWYTGTVAAPAVRQEKVFSGEEERQISLLLGRKRIKLFGNSSISDSTCDKMVCVKRLSLPGYTFPIAIETVINRPYSLKTVPISREEAETCLRSAWKRELLSSMVAGKIESTEAHMISNRGYYILQAESTCTEMIAKPAPISPPDKGDTNE